MVGDDDDVDDAVDDRQAVCAGGRRVECLTREVNYLP